MIFLGGPEETKKLAKMIGSVAQKGDNLVLTGDLGAGKTTLTKGIAEGLGIEQMIKSPTYTIIREYLQGRLPLYHMDVYRTGGSAGDLGLDEYFEGEGLSVIEWGNLLEDYLPEDYLEVILTKDPENSDHRQVAFQSHGPAGQQFEARILAKWRAANE
ncbi:tRNA (adenosine(37)-N6)-threonylcarbamoyltransferase complex ATPase subunit type 1 TsaE [Enterococcus sp. LJL98]